MSAKKGLELLKAIGQYMTEAEGFDRVLKNVRKVWRISKFFLILLTFGLVDFIVFPLHPALI